MKAELALLLLRKLKIANATKLGLSMAVVTFIIFDIEGLAKRVMAPKEST